MARAKQPTKRNRRSKAIPVLGIAGVSFAMAGGASAATGGAAADVPAQNATTQHQLFLGEEELSDVSLSTFYVFDKENAATAKAGDKLAWGCRCGGCRCGGCRCGWRGCGGCGGCGGCAWCWSRGGCRAC
jgi:hypothetical protein